MHDRHTIHRAGRRLLALTCLALGLFAASPATGLVLGFEDPNLLGSATTPGIPTWSPDNRRLPPGWFSQDILPWLLSDANGHTPTEGHFYVGGFAIDINASDFVTTLTGLLPGITCVVTFDAASSAFAGISGLAQPTSLQVVDAPSVIAVAVDDVSAAAPTILGGGTFALAPGRDPLQPNWSSYSYAFTPTTTTANLLFTGTLIAPGTAAGWVVDRVEITHAVPEPAGWIMLVASLSVGVLSRGSARIRRSRFGRFDQGAGIAQGSSVGRERAP